MDVVQPAPLVKESPDTEFWRECRRRAEILNVPAWQLAEERFTHGELNPIRTSRV